MEDKIYIDGKPYEGGVINFECVPILAPGGMIQDDLFGNIEGSVEVKIKKKAISKIHRSLKREIMGKNNWRKLHGMPMYRKYR